MMTVRLRTVMISLVEAVRRMRRTDEKVKHKSLTSSTPKLRRGFNLKRCVFYIQ